MVSFAALELPTYGWTVGVARHTLRGLLGTAGVAGEICEDLALALTEACSNAVRHASAGALYRVRIQVDTARCLMEVHDQGPGFDPGLVPTPEPTGGGHRGLLMMRAVVDQIRVDALRPRGTKITLVKTWDSTPAGRVRDGDVDQPLRAVAA